VKGAGGGKIQIGKSHPSGGKGKKKTSKKSSSESPFLGKFFALVRYYKGSRIKEKGRVLIVTLLEGGVDSQEEELR